MTQLDMPPLRELLDIDAARALVDPALEAYFVRNIAKARAIDPHYASLWESMLVLLRAGGKRIRPYLTLLTYQAFCDRPVEPIVPIASAQELLHLSLLIHDDVIDRDYVRYGTDNISGQYDKLYAPLVSNGSERRHFSNSAAILAGDLLLSGSYQLVLESRLPDEQMRIATDVFGEAVFTVAGGELLDIESAFRQFDLVDSVAIAKHKTAHYSFVTPIVMGARLAGVDEHTASRLAQFGEDIGIAYQLVDDILGVFGSQALTGKSNINDIQEAKHTYLIEQFKANASAEQSAIVDGLFGKKNLTESEAQTFRDVLMASGAKERTEQAIDAYTKRALETLADIPMNDKARLAFETLVERSIRRER